MTGRPVAYPVAAVYSNVSEPAGYPLAQDTTWSSATAIFSGIIHLTSVSFTISTLDKFVAVRIACRLLWLIRLQVS